MQDKRIDLTRISNKKGLLRNYVGGEWIDSSSSESRDVVNPATNEVIARVPLSIKEETEEAIKIAKGAFEEWKVVPLNKRANYLFRLKHLMEDSFEEIAETVVQEMGKTINEARGEVRRGIEEIDCACGIPSLMKGYLWEDVSPGVDLQVALVPMGVFFMVPSYNFPALVPLEYMPYSVACGNTYIVKPSSEVPITQAKIFELIEKAGFPPGVVNMVHGSREVVDQLMISPDTIGFSFVGSTEVGKYLYEVSAKYGKRAQCACGAKNHVVVMPDANLDLAVNAMMASFFGCAGQRCLAGEVAVPVGDNYLPLKNKFVEAASRLKVGYGLDESVQMGPLVSKKQKERVIEFIDSGLEEGAKLLLDGRNLKVESFSDGAFIGPTVFDEVTKNMVIAKEEIFGPVACIIPAKNLDDALEIIEDGRYGHSALIFTSSGKVAREFRQRASCGNIGINMGLAATQAFSTLGGLKESAYGDLHGRSESILFFTDRKILVSRWF